MSIKHKRKLTDLEIKELRAIMESAPQGRKPSVRWFSRYFGVNQPSIIKSLGGWEGIERGRPEKAKKPEIIQTQGTPVKIEEYSTKIEYEKR
jgi:hypothetical protein